MVGEHALLAECVRLWRERGHRVTALVSPEAALRDWAGERGITSLPRLDSLEAALDGEPFDYLFSITNMRIVPQRLLDLPRRMAVNFHDALLPRHAGVQATSWALLESPAEHGVTWHVMTAGADEGDVLLRRCFDVGPDDTAYDLNTACFQAGTDSFAELADLLAAGRAAPEPQDMRLRTYHGRGDVLPGGGLLRWTRGGRGLHALVRAAALGRSENAFGTAKLPLPGGGYLVVGRSRLSPAAPGARPRARCWPPTPPASRSPPPTRPSRWATSATPTARPSPSPPSSPATPSARETCCPSPTRPRSRPWCRGWRRPGRGSPAGHAGWRGSVRTNCPTQAGPAGRLTRPRVPGTPRVTTCRFPPRSPPRPAAPRPRWPRSRQCSSSWRGPPTHPNSTLGSGRPGRRIRSSRRRCPCGYRRRSRGVRSPTTAPRSPPPPRRTTRI